MGECVVRLQLIRWNKPPHVKSFLFSVTLTIRKLEQEILAAGHCVCILTTASGDLDNTHLDGTHANRKVIFMNDAIPIPFLQDPKNPELSYHLGFALSPVVKAEIEAFGPTIIHLTVPDCSALHIVQYARTKEVPIMGTFHSNIPEYMKHYPGVSWLKILLGAFIRHQYNFLQALYVPTPFIQKYLADTYKMDKVTNIGVWGRGVDIDNFNPHHRDMKYRRNFGIKDDCVVICWVGRLVPEKRPDIFANVIRRLVARGKKNFHALVIGAGPCEDQFKNMPQTTFCGWMTPDQLSVAYASSDVFLFPSAVETFGNVTLEAASSGLPVVVDEGCSGHLVRQGENGFKCPTGDEEAFFEATLELVEDSKLREKCSKASRQLALGLEKRTVVRGMLDNYSSVTDQFFLEYQGHHANRDQEFKKMGSFRTGNHPRPLVLIMVEYLTICLFLVIYNMTSAFTAFQEGVLSIVSHDEPPASQQQQQHAVDESSTSTSTSETNSSENADGRHQLTRTRSNSSLMSDEFSQETPGAFSPEVSQPKPGVVIAGEEEPVPISHMIVSVLIAIVEYQCLIESTLRNVLFSCFVTPAMKLQRASKRKCSFSDEELQAARSRMESKERQIRQPLIGSATTT